MGKQCCIVANHIAGKNALISKVINICQKEKNIMLVGDNPKMILTGRSESAPFLKCRAQSFTLLKADLRQDIIGGFAVSRYLNGTFP